MRIRAVVLAIGAISVGCAQLSHGGPVRDHVSLVDNIRARGVHVDPVDRVSFALLSVPGTRLVVSGGALAGPMELMSFSYDDTDLDRDGRRVAQDDAARITPDGASAPSPSGVITVAYPGPPHFFHRERVIVLYVGDQPELLKCFASSSVISSRGVEPPGGAMIPATGRSGK